MQMKYGLLLFHDSIFLTENLAFLLDSDPLILFKSGIITIYLFILGPVIRWSPSIWIHSDKWKLLHSICNRRVWTIMYWPLTRFSGSAPCIDMLWIVYIAFTCQRTSSIIINRDITDAAASVGVYNVHS